MAERIEHRNDNEEGFALDALEGRIHDKDSIYDPALDTLEEWAMATALEVPEQLKKSIHKKISIQSEVKTTKPSFSWHWLNIAASLLIGGSIGFNLFLSQEKSKLEDQVLQLQAQNQSLALQESVWKTKYSTKSHTLGIMTDVETKVIALKGQNFAKEAKGKVFWNQDHVYLSIQSFPEIQKEEDFQLWAIVDGKPVDAGVFQPGFFGEEGLIEMKSFQKAEAFAVTIEKKGGSPSPTLAKMVVLGTTSDGV